MTSELIWQYLDTSGWEHVRVIDDHPGWTVFDSILAREHEGQVLRGGYTLVVDKQWRTLELRLMIESTPGSMEGIHLLTEGDGRWTDANEQHVPELDGCLDVDIPWTALSHSLPINCLGLQPGSEKTVGVAHIALPDLLIVPMVQKYERQDATTVRYAGGSGSPETQLAVDAHGFVTQYLGRFSRTWPR